MVSGTHANAEALRDDVAGVLAPMGLILSEDKTRVVYLDEGFDFLGFRIQRRQKRGTNQHHVYTYPSKTTLAAIKAKVRRLTHRTSPIPPRALLLRVNAVLRGWANYFRYGVSKRTFSYLDSFAWRRVTRWLRRRHHGLSWKPLRRRFMRGWDIVIEGVALLMPSNDQGVPLPLPRKSHSNTLDGDLNRKLYGMNSWRAGCAETCTSGSEGGPRKRIEGNLGTAARSDPSPTSVPGRAITYLAFVLDLFSRRIVGWSMRNDLRPLVLDALNMAIANRKPAPDSCIIPTRIPSTLRCVRERLRESGIVSSMGSTRCLRQRRGGVVPCYHQERAALSLLVSGIRRLAS